MKKGAIVRPFYNNMKKGNILNKKAYDIMTISEAIQRVPEIITAFHHVHHNLFNALAPHLKSMNLSLHNVDFLHNIGSMSTEAIQETLMNFTKNPEVKKAIKKTIHTIADIYDDYHMHKPHHEIYRAIINEKLKSLANIKNTLKEKIDGIFNFFKRHQEEKGEKIFNWHSSPLDTLKQRIKEVVEKIKNQNEKVDASEIRKYIFQQDMDFSIFKKYAREIINKRYGQK